MPFEPTGKNPPPLCRSEPRVPCDKFDSPNYIEACEERISLPEKAKESVHLSLVAPSLRYERNSSPLLEYRDSFLPVSAFSRVLQ